jgi:hypothetical protein
MARHVAAQMAQIFHSIPIFIRAIHTYPRNLRFLVVPFISARS